MLNATQILEEELLVLENSKGKSAQVGFDVSLHKVNQVGGINEQKIGKVLVDKTELNVHTEIQKIQLDGKTGWLLHPGFYDFVLNEGCKIPSNRTGFIKQRSSLLRNGALIQSSVFDPGFETDQMGTYCVVFETIFIEENARVAQMYFHESTPTDQVYNGQWQNDKQRK